MHNPRVWGAFILLSLVWGSSFLFIRLGLRQLSPLSLVALRLVIGALGIWVVGLRRRRGPRLPGRSLLALLVIAGVNTTIPFLLIAWGEETVPSGMASVLNSTTPIFAIIIAGLILQDEPITARKLSGVLVGLIGVVILASRDLKTGGVDWELLIAQGAIVVASFSYAFGPVLVRRWLPSVGSMTLATATLTISAIEALILSLIFSPPPLPQLHPLTLLAVVWLGLLGSSLGYLLYYFIIQNWGAGRATLVTYMLPVVGLTLGSVILSEPLGWQVLGGSALVVGGVVLASLVTQPRAAGTATEGRAT